MSDLQPLLEARIEPAGEEDFYTVEGRTYVRTTHALHRAMPPYLVPWAEKVGHEGMYRLLSPLPNSHNPDAGFSLEQARAAIKNAGWDCESEKTKGGTRGAELHFSFESWIKQGVPPTLEDFEPEHRGYAQTLCQFLVDYQPEFECSELTVFHAELMYAGTIDAIGRATTQPKGVRHPNIVGKRLAWDLKSNKAKKVYLQHYFQLASYELALEHHGVEMDGSAVVAVGPGQERGKPYRVAVNYVRPEQWVHVLNLYRVLEAVKHQNPNSRANGKASNG